MPIPKRNNLETKDNFINLCMSDKKMVNQYDVEQRLAVCTTQLAAEKISFDFDGTISLKKYTDLAKQLAENNVVYIISARSSKAGMQSKAKQIGIPFGNVYATGSNEAKIKKVKELGITKHYDNNIDVVKALKGIGIKV